MEFTTEKRKVEFRAQLLRTLDLIHGPFRLVLAPSLVGALGACVADVATLKAHGVETFDTLDGEIDAVGASAPSTTMSSTVVYLIHGTVESSARAARHAGMLVEALTKKNGKNKNQRKEQLEVYVISFPRVMRIAKAMFERQQVPEAVFLPLPCAWFSLSRDVLSLEYDDAAIREMFVSTLNSPLPYDIAYALFSGGFGGAATVQARGRLSCKVAEMLRRMRKEAGRDLANVLVSLESATGAMGVSGTDGRENRESSPVASRVSHATAGAGAAVDELILIDRISDMVTPMCTQLTYAGLLDEVFGMRHGQVKQSGLKVRGLDDDDPVFRETRDKMFLGARTWINSALREIQQFRDVQMADADVSALRGFVASLKDNFSRMTLHASLLEKLGSRMAARSFVSRQRVEAGILDETLETQSLSDIIYGEDELMSVLRLMCLRCAAGDGIAKREFDVLRKEVLNTYGFEHIETFERLQEAGILYEKEDRSRSAFATSRGPMKLLVDDASKIDAENPEDIHFAYAGYAPWSCRMVEEACSAGWRTRLDGRVPTIHVRQALYDDGSAHDAVAKDIPVRNRSKSPGSTARNVFVVFIGGVTSAEIAALRFLAERDGLLIQVGCTGLINGTRLVQSLLN